MTNILPEIPDTGKYSVPETCKILGITRPTLYRKERQGWIRCGRRRDNHRKFYTGLEIKKFFRKTTF